MKKIHRRDIDGNEFHILVDGEKKFVCEREVLKDGSRGFWLLKMPTVLGNLQVDRDRYSNDLIERVGIHVNERQVYGKRFKLQVATEANFYANINDWIEDLSVQFGNEWSGEFDEFMNEAIIEVLE